MKSNKSNPAHSSKKGKCTEYLFAAKCMELGLIVCFPCTEDLQYDYVVDTGKKLVRIQVKTATRDKQKSNRWYANTKSSNRAYDKRAFDYYAIFLTSNHPNGTWYIIPKKAVTVSGINLPRDKYEKYKEAWRLI